MRIFVYPTDHDWFRFLRARSTLDEVNFWQPAGYHPVRAIEPGEPRSTEGSGVHRAMVTAGDGPRKS